MHRGGCTEEAHNGDAARAPATSCMTSWQCTTSNCATNTGPTRPAPMLPPKARPHLLLQRVAVGAQCGGVVAYAAEAVLCRPASLLQRLHLHATHRNARGGVVGERRQHEGSGVEMCMGVRVVSGGSITGGCDGASCCAALNASRPFALCVPWDGAPLPRPPTAAHPSQSACFASSERLAAP